MTMSVLQLQTRQALLKRGIPMLIAQGESLATLLMRLVENVEAQADKMLAAVFLYEPERNDLTIGAAPSFNTGHPLVLA